MKDSLKSLIPFIILLFLAAAGAGYYVGVKVLSPRIEAVTKNLPSASPEVSVTLSPTTTPAPVGDIAWIEPKEIPTINLLRSDYAYGGPDEMDFRGGRFYSVGTFSAGKYKGGQILIAMYPPELGVYSNLAHLVRFNGKIIWLAKHSLGLYDGDGFDRTKFVVDEDFVIPSLVAPLVLETSKGKLYDANYYNQYGDQGLSGDTIGSRMFKKEGLFAVLLDPKVGQIYTDIVSADKVTPNGFYYRAPDGTVREYVTSIPFIDERGTPNVTWTDGTKNNTAYHTTVFSGCGSKNYISVVAGLGEKDLSVAGKTNTGENIYALKDSNHPILKKIYDEYGLGGIREDAESYEKFSKSRPAFFWYDAFGRLIKFQNSDFISPAECGKPVIYLYPEQTTEVSVKVNPRGGMTKSDPHYGNGWLVSATPESEITLLSSGAKYPYLFWEGRGGLYEAPKKGFVVAQKDVHGFLVEKLAKFGLNEKETADFMEFWEPRMTGSPYYFVGFLGTQSMNALAPLDISPKPDTVVRILMDFTPLKKPIEVEGYDIKTPVRKGFTVIEWGGVIR